MNVEIRGYQPGDERGLVALFGRAFGRSTTEQHWLWKFRQSQTSYENVWIATADGDYVGQYAGVPVRGRSKGETTTAIAVFDAMVDPRMRRQGLLTSMGARAQKAWADAGVRFVTGLPNEQWGSRAAALGWKPAFPLQWLVWVLRPEGVLARRSGIPALRQWRGLGQLWRGVAGRSLEPNSAITVAELEESVAHLDSIAESPGNSSGTVRGASWCQWRYFDCPSGDYHVLLACRNGNPAGYAVYRTRGESPVNAVLPELLVADDDQEVRNALVGDIIKRCLDAGADTISTLAVPGTPNHRALGNCGFMPRRAAFTVQYVPLQSDRDAIGLDWLLTGGDFDVV